VALEPASSVAALLSIAEEDNGQARRQQYLLISKLSVSANVRPYVGLPALSGRGADAPSGSYFLIAEVASAVGFADSDGLFARLPMTGSFLAMT
jgi:hypothetical protein